MTDRIASSVELVSVLASTLDHAAVKSDGSLAFRILRIDLTALRYDGTPPRNKCIARVEVDGEVHIVTVRSERGNAHVQKSLKHHQLRERIAIAVVSAAALAARGLLPVGEPLERAAWVRHIL
jgi:hypothetical protein